MINFEAVIRTLTEKREELRGRSGHTKTGPVSLRHKEIQAESKQ